MKKNYYDEELPFGSKELRLPRELRRPLLKHLQELKSKYLEQNWGKASGFGKRPALIVVDLARLWTDPSTQMGTVLDSVVEATCCVLEAARNVKIPIFFTALAYEPRVLLNNFKIDWHLTGDPHQLFELDPRLKRRSSESIIYKRYASAFKGTPLLQLLAAQGIDTLIVTGVSTSHCIYATCRDAVESFRVIVPEEAVGERCEIMHRVNLLDIEIDLGDVLSTQEVVKHVQNLKNFAPPK